jgi:predicted MFS family arabinose efflux permease
MFAVAVLGVAASPRFEVALVCQVFAGWGLIRYLATTNTLLQLIVDERYRGRMMGLHAVMFLGTQPFGGLALGALAQGFGARRAALVSRGASLAAALWLALRLRRVALRERDVEAVAS